MRCDQAELRLQTLLDNRQQVEDDTALTEHLASCGECATLASAYQALAADRCEPLPSSNISLADRVMSEIAADPQPTKTIVREPYAPHQHTSVSWYRWASLAIAASVMVAILFNQDPSTTPVAPPNNPSAVPMIADAVPHTSYPVEQAPGREVWFRTGQGLASISLVGLSNRNMTTPETEAPSDSQMFRWPLPNSLPEMDFLPSPSDSATPKGETGLLFRNVTYGVV
ncbi:hypothetical protein [Aeoliella mucimassa]|uniref:Zinc-finger domain-containing protein n=1 Tax=Aeoliella mucimassa TaxID=2527972 RepID=A0A518AIQ4_9BACT|nr:hypothetical protein [Aeoliella mucimassa]QDU54597.1 hypothetical protein Pan181_07800 [Aeoliella mucimassa]